MTPELIAARTAFLQTDRKIAEERWVVIESQIAPYRGMFMYDITNELGVPLNKADVYDGTALQSAQTLAANLHGNLTSPYTMWFSLAFGRDTLQDDPEARAWLEECADIIWKELQKSNFSKEVAEGYLDLTTFATTFMFEEAKEELEWDGVLFNSIPLKECYFEEDACGGINTFYRVLRWTPVQLCDKFGDKVPLDIQEIAKGPTATAQRFEVIFCVWQRKKKERMQWKKLPPKRRPYGCRYILKRDALPLTEESGYYEMPVFATRWAKVSESQWGHGPSHVAIYDVQALNRQEMLTMQALEKTIDPPQKTTERGVIGDLDLRPGGLTVLRTMDDLQPMEFGTQWAVVGEERQNRRNMIREYYMISKLDLKESPAMTATEVERRWQQMQKLLGPTLGRLQSDLLGPVIETTFSLLMRAGRLPQMPQVLLQEGVELDIEYTGPLPIAQKADLAGAIERELGLASNLAATYGPDAMDALDVAKAVREHARLTAVPAKVLRTDAEIKKRQDERKKSAEQDRAMQQGLAQAEAAKNAGAGAKNMAEAHTAANEMEGPAEDMAEGGVEEPNAAAA